MIEWTHRKKSTHIPYQTIFFANISFFFYAIILKKDIRPQRGASFLQNLQYDRVQGLLFVYCLN